MNKKTSLKREYHLFYSSLFFPTLIKEEVFTLYAYVRIIDDAVDQKVANTKLFHDLKKQTEQAWKGSTIPSLIVTQFVQLAKKGSSKKVGRCFSMGNGSRFGEEKISHIQGTRALHVWLSRSGWVDDVTYFIVT